MTNKRPKKYKLPRPMTFVKPLEGNEYWGLDKPFQILYIGEIKNMPGHGLFLVDKQFEIGLHIDSFVELTEDET
jgi:hypothetical protein